LFGKPGFCKVFEHREKGRNSAFNTLTKTSQGLRGIEQTTKREGAISNLVVEEKTMCM
jgi:hypothetical protein